MVFGGFLGAQIEVGGGGGWGEGGETSEIGFCEG